MSERFFRKNDGFVEQSVGGETILVPLVDSVAKMDEVITLNDLGTFIYHMLTERKSFSELVKSILDTYDVEKSVAVSDLNRFIADALKKKIIFEQN